MLHPAQKGHDGADAKLRSIVGSGFADSKLQTHCKPSGIAVVNNIAKLLLSTCAIALISVSGQQPPVAVQQAQQQKEEPKTKLEQFQAKTGSVIIMAYSKVGAFSAQYGASVEVQTREFTDASTGAKQYGVFITVKETKPYEREDSSFIDFDEIESLIKGIEYISGVTSEVSKLPMFQAEYRTRGDLMVSTFGSSTKTQIEAVIKSGRYGSASAYMSRSDLAKFRESLRSALETMQALKGP